VARLARLVLPKIDCTAYDGILVLGNQKTGSTAIAQLLAALGDLRIAANLHSLHGRAVLPNSPSAVARFVQAARYYLRHDVVKENALTPATDALLEVLPQARVVYVVRHPVQNVRSILDRVGLPGRPLPLTGLALPGGWAPIVTGRDLGVDAADTITALAERWAVTTDLYRRHADRMRLVRYEDFVADKSGTIRALAEDLGVPDRQAIAPLVDVPFQPRGAHRSAAPADFFTDDALTRIRERCQEGMDALDYAPLPASP